MRKICIIFFSLFVYIQHIYRHPVTTTPNKRTRNILAFSAFCQATCGELLFTICHKEVKIFDNNFLSLLQKMLVRCSCLGWNLSGQKDHQGDFVSFNFFILLHVFFLEMINSDISDNFFVLYHHHFSTIFLVLTLNPLRCWHFSLSPSLSDLYAKFHTRVFM